jgi:hypothetical protein
VNHRSNDTTENSLLSDTGKIDLRGQVFIEIHCNRQPVPAPASDLPSSSPAALVGAVDRAGNDAGPDYVYRLVFDYIASGAGAGDGTGFAGACENGLRGQDEGYIHEGGYFPLTVRGNIFTCLPHSSHNSSPSHVDALNFFSDAAAYSVFY